MGGCASVAYCISPYYDLDGNCQCESTDQGEVPYSSSTCAMINCSEGKSCNPATGTCSSSDGSGLELGYSPPLPLPVVTESMRITINPKVNKMPDLIRSFGSTGLQNGRIR